MREIMSGGDVPRAQAQEWVDEMVDRSRKATEGIVDMIRSEVANQLAALGVDPEDLARQAADILRRSADAGRRVMQDMAQSRGGRGPSGTGASSRPRPPATPAKAAAPKKAAKKTAPSAKKAAPTKAAPKKAPAKKTAPSARKASSVKAAKKGAVAKKSPAKKAAASPAKKQGSGTTR